MSRLELNHLAWSKSLSGRHTHDLADSGVAPPDLPALGLPSTAGLSRDATGIQRQLESALGARLSAPSGRVLVTAGASEANAAVFAGLLSPGDVVLVERPGYEPHRSVARLFGARVHEFTRARSRDFGDVAGAVEGALAPGTRLVVLTHLHNPSGVALTDDDAASLERLAERHGFRILCDETFRDADAAMPAGTLASRGPRWVTTSSLTKSYGLGGLRIGWIAADAGVLARCAEAQNALSVNPSSPSVALALALVPHLDVLRARSHRILAGNHARWLALAARNANGAVGAGGPDTGVPPRGTTAWWIFPGMGEGDEFAAFAAARFDTVVTPGGFFGDPCGVRIGVGGEPERFARALDSLERALVAFGTTRVRIRKGI